MMIAFVPGVGGRRSAVDHLVCNLSSLTLPGARKPEVG